MRERDAEIYRLRVEREISLTERFELQTIEIDNLRADVERLKAERDALRAAILQNCKEGCKGREAYTGKLRHEPNCLAWDLDLDPEKNLDTV